MNGTKISDLGMCLAINSEPFAEGTRLKKRLILVPFMPVPFFTGKPCATQKGLNHNSLHICHKDNILSWMSVFSKNCNSAHVPPPD